MTMTKPAKQGAVTTLTKTHLAPMYIAHPEETRYAMNGVLIEPAGKVVATNGKAMVVQTYPKPFPLECPVVLDLATVKQVRGKLTKTSHATFPSPADGALNVAIETRKGATVCPLVQGVFPPYEDVLPKDPDTSRQYTIPVVSLAAICRPFADFQGFRWHVSGGPGFNVTARDPEHDLELHLTFAGGPDGGAIEIGLDPALMLDLCRAAKGAGVTDLIVSFGDAKGATILEGEGEGCTWLGLIMPLNLGA